MNSKLLAKSSSSRDAGILPREFDRLRTLLGLVPLPWQNTSTTGSATHHAEALRFPAAYVLIVVWGMALRNNGQMRLVNISEA